MARSVAHRLKGETLWRLATGTVPFSVAGYSAGDVIEVDDGNGVIQEITVSGPAAVAALRPAGTDAYLEGPALPAGTTAVTVLMSGLNVPIQEIDGYKSVFEWIGLIYEVNIALKSNARSLNFTLRDSNGDSSNVSLLAAVPSPMGVVPGQPVELLVSATLNDGTGTARVIAFVNGTEVAQVTAPSGVTDVFSTSRVLRIIRDTEYAASIERFRAFTGYSADGSTSGLTLLPGHDISAEDFNTGNGTIVKKGTGSFTIG